MVTWLSSDYAAQQYLALNSSFQAFEELTRLEEGRDLTGLEMERLPREGDQKRPTKRQSIFGRWLRLDFLQS